MTTSVAPASEPAAPLATLLCRRATDASAHATNDLAVLRLRTLIPGDTAAARIGAAFDALDPSAVTGRWSVRSDGITASYAFCAELAAYIDRTQPVAVRAAAAR